MVDDTDHIEDDSLNLYSSQAQQPRIDSNFANMNDEPGFHFEDDIDSLLALEESFNHIETSQSHEVNEELPSGLIDLPVSKKINLGDGRFSKLSNNHPPFETSFTQTEKNPFISSKSSDLKESTNDDKIDYFTPSLHGRLTLATNSQGKTLYIPRRSEASKRNKSLLRKNQAAQKGLLSVSIYAILDKLDLKKTTNNSTKPDSLNKRRTTQAGQLWVEKYRPKKFMDLIGDQRLNREALEWLKQWDYCVFNKKVGKVSQGLIASSDKQFQSSDFLRRPEQKILLLCGPPGLGKTSLAHAIGYQCGYNCIEINASDDRAGTGVKERISNALETRSMFGDKKPNLVIIDEIDGVSNAGGNQSFINTLLNLASIEENATSKKDSTKKKAKILKRPIICICNDPFVPALRTLRPHSKILTFKKSPTALIVEHLKEICSSEKVTISSHSLTALCEITDGDLRSSLNSLQFLSESNNQHITFENISENSAGAKDTPKSLFFIWDSLFQLPSSRISFSQKRVFDEVDNQSSKPKYFDVVVSYVFTHGGFNIIIDGCFENYLNAKYIDTYMEKVCYAGEWLTWFDNLDTRVNTQQQLGLFSYFAYPIIAFHNLFATASPKRIEFPKLDRKHREVFKANSNLLASFYVSLSPLIRRSFSRQLQPLYFIFYALKIIDIESHEVNLQLMRPQEKLHVQNIVKKMIGLNLRYIQHLSSDNSITFELEPPLNLLVQLGTVESASASYFSSASLNELKKYINHQIEIESVRQKEISIHSKSMPLINSNQSDPTKPDAAKSIKPSYHDISNNLAKITLISLPEKSLRANPFSKFVRRSTKNESSASTSSVSNHPKSWFVYLDGYSNAVRTPLYMDEL